MQTPSWWTRHFTQSLGGHDMVLVGYSDKTCRFIARNSWGAGVMDGGYCYFEYAYLTNSALAYDFWIINP